MQRRHVRFGMRALTSAEHWSVIRATPFVFSVGGINIGAGVAVRARLRELAEFNGLDPSGVLAFEAEDRRRLHDASRRSGRFAKFTTEPDASRDFTRAGSSWSVMFVVTINTFPAEYRESIR